ncbi:PIN domain-containing protein [Flavobacterium sp. NRK F10]|uniref:PIN domain-containing protein n=1 Tax=Flavobacterium sp. NRK F10 TaxID=2954931 RepID=UPI0020918B77|nr:PIN domain-containing protein [Flavobacterium sp. NRK F10]MCO6175632.1 PIN domain-containing protein [Flavobacterium sp. NRK F10]
MIVKLIIDTCVWLDIAKTSKGEEILNLLSEFIEREEVKIVLPEIVISEFDRNKERIIADAGKSLSSHFKKVKEMVAEHADQESKQIILSQLNDIDKKIPTLGENAFQAILTIEDIMSKAEIINISDEIKLRATQRAIDKKAPFHLSKNSIGDSIIIESYNYYKVQNIAQEFNLMFITHNVNDFSLKNGNQKMPHEDLADIFDSSKSQYFINLPEALNSVNPELIEEIEYENDWDFEFRSFSQILEMERELEQKIWYNRHKNREYLIETGKIKLINREEFDIKKSQRAIIKDIWEGALKSAKKVEEIYGEENLSFNDFEWGMINGKLSALRWVIGDDWDNLDT